MAGGAAELSRQLAQRAEAVCRRYLPAGRREGAYWRVGDVHNTPGRSLYVRLEASSISRSLVGRYCDASTGAHGDLLDLIRESRRHTTLRDAIVEARAFLGMPGQLNAQSGLRPQAPYDSLQACRRLIAVSQPIPGTIAHRYLAERGIWTFHEIDALRFHPSCAYRDDDRSRFQRFPAMLAIVTDEHGETTGIHRTWLSPDGRDKAPVSTPRRSLGRILGHGVRFGAPADVMAIGEGIETTLSLKFALPTLPMIAALSAGHLAAIALPKNLRRLYVARDADAAGEHATARLIDRAIRSGIEAHALTPRTDDFNGDLKANGLDALKASLRGQFAPPDVARFLMASNVA